MCVDYRVSYNITVKYRHSISKIDDKLNELHRLCVFSKINLKSRYYKIKMKEKDK